MGEETPNIQGSSPATIFIIGKTRSKSLYSYAMWFGNNNPTAYSKLWIDINQGGAQEAVFRFAGASVLYNEMFNDQPFISTWAWSDATSESNYNLYVDGVLQSSSARTSVNSINLINDFFVIGAAFGTGQNCQNYYNGQISEIIIFNRLLKNSEREAVEKYLSQKYNIPIIH